MIELTCQGCGALFSRSEKQHRASLKRGRTIIACSLPCVNRARGHIKQTYICLECSQSFSRSKTKTDTCTFCSRSCAALFNNKLRDVKEYFCSVCLTNPVKNRKTKYCKSCRTRSSSDTRRLFDPVVTTLADFKKQYSISQYHAKLRAHSRLVYEISGKPYICFNCGYSLHVDICHIRPVADYPLSSTVAEVNDIGNLIALDKRCHWEFDNGHLTLDI